MHKDIQRLRHREVERETQRQSREMERKRETQRSITNWQREQKHLPLPFPWLRPYISGQYLAGWYLPAPPWQPAIQCVMLWGHLIKKPSSPPPPALFCQACGNISINMTVSSAFGHTGEDVCHVVNDVLVWIYCFDLDPWHKRISDELGGQFVDESCLSRVSCGSSRTSRPSCQSEE